jgi:hypothetical protein
MFKSKVIDNDITQEKTDYKKAVTINLWASTHKKLRMYAAEHDTNVSALLEKWAQYHMEEGDK